MELRGSPRRRPEWPIHSKRRVQPEPRGAESPVRLAIASGVFVGCFWSHPQKAITDRCRLMKEKPHALKSNLNSCFYFSDSNSHLCVIVCWNDRHHDPLPCRSDAKDRCTNSDLREDCRADNDWQTQKFGFVLCDP